MGLMHFDFLSEVLGYHTNIYYLLPDCTHKGQAPRATLYLLHGGGGNGLDWIRYTALERLVHDYNIAVVMPEVDGSCFYADMKHGYNYFTYLTKEVVAISEGMLPVNREREKRLVAGLSMGGYGAFKWAFLRPEMFYAAANLSGFSLILELFGEGSPVTSDALAKNGVVELNWGSLAELRGSESDSQTWLDNADVDSLPLLFAGIGTEDMHYKTAQNFLAYAASKGISIHSEEMPGKHEWFVFEEMLSRFLAFAL